MAKARARRNLDLLEAAIQELDYDQRATLYNYLLGYVANQVPEATWAEGVAAGLVQVPA